LQAAMKQEVSKNAVTAIRFTIEDKRRMSVSQ